MTAILVVCLMAPHVFGQTTEFSEMFDLRLRMLAAEDARVDRPEDLVPFVEGLSHRDALLQRIAVRALGRLERPALAPQIALGFRSSDIAVRIDTARALAQSARRGGAADARRELLARLSDETAPEVRGAIADAVGRLTYETADGLAAAERDILTASVDQALAPGLLLPMTGGLEALARRHTKIGRLTDTTLELLRRAAQFGRDHETKAPDAVQPAETGRRVRRLAVAALAASVPSDPGVIDALDDPDDQVRRVAYRAAISTLDDAEAVAVRGLRDASWLVRFETLASAVRRTPAVPCAVVRPLLDDQNPHVVLAAIDAVATVCEGDPETAARLARWAAPPVTLAGGVTAGHGVGTPAPLGWHRRARAFVALAALDPDTARKRLSAFAAEEVWQVRVAAVRAAATLGDADTLERLAADPVDNVREAALQPLLDLRGAGALPFLLAALGRDDPQVVLTAARLVEPLPADPRLADGLAAALDRVTALKRETSRDIRLALVAALRQHAKPPRADWLRPYLGDFDPLVAARAADTLSAWTGEPQQPSPRPLPRSPLPTTADLRRMADLSVTLHMSSGARVALRLLPDEAPLNAFRFLRLAEAGYYDGLTFHRVVPGFVVQGGSPGANEYWSDGPFSRDEVGRSNLRGTVGLSTRGRDTGDAQFYVNLVDNVRLDDDYTVFAEVVRGMEDVDAFLEGERIQRVEVTGPAAEPVP